MYFPYRAQYRLPKIRVLHGKPVFLLNPRAYFSIFGLANVRHVMLASLALLLSVHYICSLNWRNSSARVKCIHSQRILSVSVSTNQGVRAISSVRQHTCRTCVLSSKINEGVYTLAGDSAKTGKGVRTYVLPRVPALTTRLVMRRKVCNGSDPF